MQQPTQELGSPTSWGHPVVPSRQGLESAQPTFTQGTYPGIYVYIRILFERLGTWGSVRGSHPQHTYACMFTCWYVSICVCIMSNLLFRFEWCSYKYKTKNATRDMHAYIYIYAYIYTYIHTYIHTHTYIYIHTHIHTRTDSSISSNISCKMTNFLAPEAYSLCMYTHAQTDNPHISKFVICQGKESFLGSDKNKNAHKSKSSVQPYPKGDGGNANENSAWTFSTYIYIYVCIYTYITQ